MHANGKGRRMYRDLVKCTVVLYYTRLISECRQVGRFRVLLLERFLSLNVVLANQKSSV